MLWSHLGCFRGRSFRHYYRGPWRGDGHSYPPWHPSLIMSWRQLPPLTLSTHTCDSPELPAQSTCFLIEEADGEPAGFGLDQASSLWVWGICGAHAYGESQSLPALAFQRSSSIVPRAGPSRLGCIGPKYPWAMLLGAKKGPQADRRRKNRHTGSHYPSLRAPWAAQA